MDVASFLWQNAAESSAKPLRRKRRKRKTRSAKVESDDGRKGLPPSSTVLPYAGCRNPVCDLLMTVEIVSEPYLGINDCICDLLTIDARNRYRSNQANFVSSGCPSCGYAHLKRMERLKRDRMLATVGVPLRRYICPECHWKGTRVNEEYFNRTSSESDFGCLVFRPIMRWLKWGLRAHPPTA